MISLWGRTLNVAGDKPGAAQVLKLTNNILSAVALAATAEALEGGWFHTGDQGEVDASGNWRITGRLKNLIILNSGHNIAPEPIEQALAAGLPEAQQVVLVGNQRSYLAALVTTAGASGSSNGAGSAAGKGIERGRIQSSGRAAIRVRCIYP